MTCRIKFNEILISVNIRFAVLNTILFILIRFLCLLRQKMRVSLILFLFYQYDQWEVSLAKRSNRR